MNNDQRKKIIIIQKNQKSPGIVYIETKLEWEFVSTEMSMTIKQRPFSMSTLDQREQLKIQPQIMEEIYTLMKAQVLQSMYG